MRTFPSCIPMHRMTIMSPHMRFFISIPYGSGFLCMYERAGKFPESHCHMDSSMMRFVPAVIFALRDLLNPPTIQRMGYSGSCGSMSPGGPSER